MINILFSKYTCFYYVFILICEYATKYGYRHLDSTGSKTILTVATFGSYLGVAFLIYYSYKTYWWAFLGLLVMNIIIFRIVNTVLVNASNTLSKARIEWFLKSIYKQKGKLL
ncbi:MAG TPA: hypothetical protein VF540_12115 [Segetibacter sp.]